MKLKQRLVKKVIADEYVYVSVKTDKDSYEGILTVTESASVLIDALAVGADRDSLIKSLTDIYDVDVQTAGRDVDALLEKLKSRDLLSE